MPEYSEVEICNNS